MIEQVGKPRSFTWRGTGLTDVGHLRASNQDAFAVRNDLGLWIVADGMGGHPGGDVASRLAVESITADVAGKLAARPILARSEGTDPRWSQTLLTHAIAASNQAIRRQVAAHPNLAGMGTTVVVLLIAPGPAPEAALAHVGDSRAYLLREGTLSRLTRDHSLVEDYIRRGLLTPEEALTHPLQHVLTRALGTETEVTPDLSIHALRAQDLLLLCTDGLTKMLDDGEIAEILRRAGSSGEAASRTLVAEANRRGGEDNVTIVVIGCEPAPVAPDPAP